MGQGSSKNLSWLYNDVPDIKTLILSDIANEDLKSLCGNPASFQGLVKGGSECEVKTFLGGYDSIQSYGDSVFSKAKEDLIRKIAGEVFSVLKLQGANYAKSAPISDVIKHLEKVVPNPKKGKKFNDSFNKSGTKQKDVCHALGNAINKHYGGKLVPMEGSENEICDKVYEVMRSLLTGLHTEFMAVAGDVLRIIRNLETLKEYISASYKRQVELIQASGDSQLKAQSVDVEEFYNRIKSELERQLAVLSNLINVAVGPTGKSLVGLLEENNEFAGLVKDLKADLGTNAFGDKLAYLLTGVSSVAHSAELIDKALKKLGMSVSEFKSAKGIQDLRYKIYNLIQKKSPSSKELDSLLAAAEIIYKNDYSHPDIVAALTKKGGDCGCSGGDDDDGGEDVLGGDFDGDYVLGDDANVLGGDDDDNETAYWSKKSLSKKINKKEKYRNLLLSDFRKVLNRHFRLIVDAANQIAIHIGKEIPTSDDLNKFINVFASLPKFDRENLHVALSGYPKDSVSREQRDNFLNYYYMLDVAVEPLTKGPDGKYFKDVQMAAKDLVKSIDDFSDKIVNAITEIHIDRPDEIKAELKRVANRFFGSADGGGGDELFGTGSYVELEKVQNELKYFYNIANIKSNLTDVAEEMKVFGEDYEQVLGEEAAFIIDSIRKEFQALIDDANPVVVEPKRTTYPGMGMADMAPAAAGVGVVARPANLGNVGYNLRVLANANLAGAPAAVPIDFFPRNLRGLTPADLTKREEYLANCYYNNLKELLTRQMNAKIKMVEASQAVDLYLRSFADGIAKNPDSIKSVVKMLDQVELVAQWFTNRSGDNLATLFEFLPYNAANDTSNVNVEPEGKIKLVTEGKEHYYQWLAEKQVPNPPPPAGGAPAGPVAGDPIYGKSIPHVKDGVKGVLSLTSKAVTSMRALDNILSSFATVGSKFGDLDPQSKTFMNVPQIFNVLCEYVITSAFTMNCTRRLAAPDAANPALYEDNLVGDCINMSFISKIPAAAAPNTASDEFWKYYNVENRSNVRPDINGNVNQFYDTDLLFQMTIKSIVCKVFTVVDAYRLFNRPMKPENYELYDSLNPLRTILGGDEVQGGYIQPAKIVPEALELYLRLPLLAEWYRDKFNMQAGRTNPALAQNNNVWRLTLAPNIDGVWSGLFGLIFDKADFVENGNYTESQVKKIIEEINNIYKHFKARHGKITVRNILNSFVMEVNRAFGFVKQEEIEKYLKSRRNYLESKETYNDDEEAKNFNKYDILDAEDQFGRNPAPSDKFLTVALKQKMRKQRNMVYLQEEIINIRKLMDAEFREYTERNRNGPVISFVDTLGNYKKELDNAKDEKSQYKLVLNLIQGANNLSVNSADKIIMLHEAVVAPLATLYNVYKVLAKYNALLHGVSLNNVAEWFEFDRDAAAGPQIGGGNTVTQQVRIDYIEFLKTKYPNDSINKDFYCKQFANALLGSDLQVQQPGVSGYLMKAVGGNIARPNLAVGALGNTVLQTMINGKDLLQDIFAAILDLCTNPNKLITCSVSTGGSINVDWNNLEDLCNNLLQQVKINLNKLRIEFTSNAAMLKKYEDMNYCGSVRWLEEHLVEILFKDRDRCGLNVAHERLKLTLDRLSERGANMFLNLDNSLRGLIYYEHVDPNNVNKFSLPNEAVPNNLTTFPFNVLPTVDENLLSANDKLALLAMKNETIDTANNNLVNCPLILFESATTLNSWNLNDNSFKSLILAFNKMLHLYLCDNLDENTLKIYTPLFEGFMNSAASKELVPGKAFPNVGNVLMIAAAVPPAVPAIYDILPTSVAVNHNLKSPEEGIVLFASNVLTMKALITNMDTRLKKKKHIYDSLLEIPEYMKERMRCNLPLYSKMFNLIFEKADLLKQLLNNTGIKEVISSSAVNEVNIQNPNNAVGQKLIDTNTKNSEAMRVYLNSLLSHLSELALSIKKNCDSVYKELQDTTAYFMELSKDFISDYKQRYGLLPLMPASNVLLPQMSFNTKPAAGVVRAFNSNVDPTWPLSDIPNLLLPNRRNGSNPYKFNYAGRMLLARPDIEPTLDHIPGAKEIYNSYSAVAQKNSVISPQEYTNTIKHMVKLARFLNDGAVYCRLFDKKSRTVDQNTVGSNYLSNSVYSEMLCISKSLKDYSQVAGFNAMANDITMHFLTATYNGIAQNQQAELLDRLDIKCYQFINDISALFNITENSNLSASKESFVRETGIAVNNRLNVDRSRLRVLNILDMNIVPINVHAFMKEVPFTNILNYSYTFDRMVHDFILPNYLSLLAPGIDKNNLLLNHESPTADVRSMMVKLLVQPYGNVNNLNYLVLIASLFNGNDDLKLGRPRYLSDQLWNKVLLTSSVNYDGVLNNSNPLALGPPGYETLKLGNNGYNQRNLNTVNNYMGTRGLKYFHDKKWKVNTNNLVRVQRLNQLRTVGYNRFNTKLVRNLVWLVQLQRIMRVVLINHLSWIDTPVIKGLKITDPIMTEYNSNDDYDKGDFNGSNYKVV